MKILVTGAAGFIGFHVAKFLCERGDDVIGIDNLNNYYSVKLKEDRLQNLEKYRNFKFIKVDISNKNAMDELFQLEGFNKVVHLAAQAGVRYSIENPHSYIDSNIVGFLNILEGCRHNDVEHLVYASSSSVYGANEKTPFSESDNVDHPVSLYAATKKSNELMAHSYSNLYNLSTTGLRFFTVYGPWGRPDMSPILFADAIINDKVLKVFNNGHHRRDFTYIDDVVDGVVLCLDQNAKGNLNWNGLTPDPSTSRAPWKIYNIGNNNSINLIDYIESIEKSLGKVARKEFLPLQPGDVENTFSDVSLLEQDLGYRPNTKIQDGVDLFIDWYLKYS